MPWLKRSVAALSGALALTVSGSPTLPAGAAQHRQPIPWSVDKFRYEGRHACHLDTAHGRARLWWSEANVQGRIPGADGSCGTLPALVRLSRDHVNHLLADEHALGLPRPGSDSWLTEPDPFTGQDLVVNGGSSALDIYLNGATGNGGSAACIRDASVPGARTGSYVLIGTPAELTRDNKPAYLTVLAHELAHVGQCALHDRRGRNGTSGSAWVVEGTANMIAAAVLPAAVENPSYRWGDPAILDEGPLGVVSDSPQRLFGAGRRSEGDPFDSSAYNTWPFWFALTDGGRSMNHLITFYRRVAATPEGHKTGDVSVLRHVFSARTLQRALLRGVRFDGLAGGLAGLEVPYGDWWWWRKNGTSSPEQKMTGVGTTAQVLQLSVPPGGTAWIKVVPATADNATLHLSVKGRNTLGSQLRSGGVVVGDNRGRTVAADSTGAWTVPLWPLPQFQVPAQNGTTATQTGAAEAWVVFANAHAATAKFRIRVTATNG